VSSPDGYGLPFSFKGVRFRQSGAHSFMLRPEPLQLISQLRNLDLRSGSGGIALDVLGYLLADGLGLVRPAGVVFRGMLYGEVLNPLVHLFVGEERVARVNLAKGFLKGAFESRSSASLPGGDIPFADKPIPLSGQAVNDRLHALVVGMGRGVGPQASERLAKKVCVLVHGAQVASNNPRFQGPGGIEYE
jgi:hypothetical protein